MIAMSHVEQTARFALAVPQRGSDAGLLPGRSRKPGPRPFQISRFCKLMFSVGQFAVAEQGWGFRGQIRTSGFYRMGWHAQKISRRGNFAGANRCEPQIFPVFSSNSQFAAVYSCGDRADRG
ncbi:hypothetical protein [Bradyrhizobium japonicum]|uniref:hypothetical protein n=1 Tax=Bradyrhizobium japonicum TaxID=375 RepID=UPI00200F8B96|nr:hypothetical protein [Bradyrhizobium japonicum]UQD96143.1 hypothetical protein JEY30_31885 [Bradyrhizobium japonicum]